VITDENCPASTTTSQASAKPVTNDRIDRTQWLYGTTCTDRVGIGVGIDQSDAIVQEIRRFNGAGFARSDCHDPSPLCGQPWFLALTHHAPLMSVAFTPARGHQ